MNTDRFIPRSAVPDYCAERGLLLSKRTLAKMATVGGGPEYQLFGGRAYYTRQALDAWMEARLSTPRRSTSDYAQRIEGRK